jgi:glycosyltransferase involved in cell wall biosynthesis
MSNRSISLVMPVYNQQNIISNVMNSILTNISNNVKEMWIILDGCTDNSESIILSNLINKRNDLSVNLVYTDNVNEVIACNIGFKSSKCDYVLNCQDDMVINEYHFDERLLKPFSAVENLLGVTGRNAQNETIIDNELKCFNVAGRDVRSLRNLFAIRDVIVRGPILLDHSKLAELGYLDEAFAPIDSDDKDLSFRAYKKGYAVGSYTIDYSSELMWGTTRKNKESESIWAQSAQKNIKLLMERHHDLLMGNKHDEDIIIE